MLYSHHLAIRNKCDQDLYTLVLIHTTSVHIQITAFTFTPITPLVFVHLISISVSVMFGFHPFLLGSIVVTCFLVCSMGPEYMYLAIEIYPITVHVSCSNLYVFVVVCMLKLLFVVCMLKLLFKLYVFCCSATLIHDGMAVTLLY